MAVKKCEDGKELGDRISIKGGWYVWTIDIGLEIGRSVLGLGVGESRAGPSR